MSAWTPAQRETDPLEAALHALIRHVLMPDVVPAVGLRNADGWYNLMFKDGRRAAIAVNTRLRADRRWGPRAALSYDFLCRAAVEHDGFAFQGRAVIDVATRAFLEIEGSLTPTGRIG